MISDFLKNFRNFGIKLTACKKSVIYTSLINGEMCSVMFRSHISVDNREQVKLEVLWSNTAMI